MGNVEVSRTYHRNSMVYGSDEVIDDYTNSPGPKKLIGGDMNAGFFGEVLASDFINGDDLAILLGITEGNPSNSSEAWLKFALNNKIIYKARKYYRDNISHTHIRATDNMYGDRSVIIRGKNYKPRLMSETINEGMSNYMLGAKGSEWNKLILPLHIKAQVAGVKPWVSPSNVDVNIVGWGNGYTSEELGLGKTIWCKNHGPAIPWALIRLNADSTDVNSINAGTKSASVVWSPVLEVA